MDPHATLTSRIKANFAVFFYSFENFDRIRTRKLVISINSTKINVFLFLLASLAWPAQREIFDIFRLATQFLHGFETKYTLVHGFCPHMRPTLSHVVLTHIEKSNVTCPNDTIYRISMHMF